MPFILVSSVVVGERIRKEIKPEAVASLAESISRIGKLIHPIVLRDGRFLVSGETRLRAHEHLGWDQIEYRDFESLTEEEALGIELEENIKRTDLSWQEQCDALRKLHELRRATEPDWSTEKTAESVGLSVSRVKDILQVAREVAKGNTRVAAQPKLSTALNVVKRERARAQANEAQTIALVEEREPPAHPFLNIDFHTWLASYDGPPFNLLHCDFPYGIDADTFNQGSASTRGGYADDFGTYSNLVDALCSSRDRLLGSSGHLIFWFSMKHYQWTLDRLREFFWVDPYPLVWMKSDNRGTLPDPKRGPRRVYEVAFLCSHGDRPVVQAVANAFAAPTVRVAEHMSEKSQPMLEHFMRMVVDKHTRILDPTAGSGSALRAARALGASELLGLEINPEFYSNAISAWLKEAPLDVKL